MMVKIFLISTYVPFISLAQQTIFETKPEFFTEQDIRKELSLYPPNILNLCVEKIEIKNIKESYYGMSHYLFKTIEINSHIPNKVEFIKTIHHELSSMFLLNIDQDYSNRTYKIYQRKFNALNPYGFKYDSQIRVKDLSDEQSKYFASNTYSMSQFENDFNMIAEVLFTDSKYLSYLNTSWPVYQKILLVIEFYHHYVDSKFTMEYFKDLKR